MFDQAVTVLFYAILTFSLLFGFINLVRSNIYDLRQSKRLRDIQLHPYARRRRRRPLVSVVIFADNSSSAVTECLQSIARGSYRKFELIVVDNSSSDDTAQLVRDFMKQHAGLNLRLVAKRKRSPRSAAIMQAADYARGEIIFIVDAETHAADKNTIKNSVLRLLEQNTQAVILNTRVNHNYSLLGLADMLGAILAARAKKAGSFIVPGLDSSNLAAAYKKPFFDYMMQSSSLSCLDSINALRRFAKFDLVYESSSVVETGVSSRPAKKLHMSSGNRLGNLINLSRAACAIAEPFVAGFMIYVALEFNNPGYVLLAWLSFTALLVLAVWSDETRGFAAKLRLSLLAFVAYSIFLIKTLLDAFSLISHAASNYRIDQAVRIK